VLYNGEGGFEGKLRALIASVSRLVGLPATGRKARKFLLRPGYKASRAELARAVRVRLRARARVRVRSEPEP
jgi:hypothetical protein|tara:strand:- start:398 stop:613 length:216 start_codon:yes stop_codon:yes gene_type:complete